MAPATMDPGEPAAAQQSGAAPEPLEAPPQPSTPPDTQPDPAPSTAPGPAAHDPPPATPAPAAGITTATAAPAALSAPASAPPAKSESSNTADSSAAAAPLPPSLSLSPTSSPSPGAALAASLVRSRASYYERLASGAARTSGPGGAAAGPSQGGAGPGPADSPGSPACPPTPRHSACLAPHPLHPLAPHPLAHSGRPGSSGGGGGGASGCRGGGAGAGGGKAGVLPRCGGELAPLGPEEEECGDTFFDRPSYTLYGANVEMSSATSYRAGSSCSGDSGSGGDMSRSSSAAALLQPEQPAGEPAAAAAASSSSGAAATHLHPRQQPEAAPDSPSGSGGECGADSPSGCPPCPATLGYVRTMSARFGRLSNGAGGGSRGGAAGGGGPEGLFDELVAHVGALLSSHPGVEAQMGAVQGLSDRLLQLHDLCQTLGRKEDEVEHLRGVLRELTTTRADAIRLKVAMAESLNGLQQEYYKVLRSAQLAQGACKQHSARAAATRQQLGVAQAELLRHRRAVAALRERNRRLRAENEDMAARLGQLERAARGADARHSACYLAMVAAQTAVMY